MVDDVLPRVQVVCILPWVEWNQRRANAFETYATFDPGRRGENWILEVQLRPSQHLDARKGPYPSRGNFVARRVEETILPALHLCYFWLYSPNGSPFYKLSPDFRLLPSLSPRAWPSFCSSNRDVGYCVSQRSGGTKHGSYFDDNCFVSFCIGVCVSLSLSSSLLLFLQLRTHSLALVRRWSPCLYVQFTIARSLLLRDHGKRQRMCPFFYDVSVSLLLFFPLQLRMITIDGRLLSYVVHDCVSFLSSQCFPSLYCWSFAKDPHPSSAG